jgi:hypothetical protein
MIPSDFPIPTVHRPRKALGVLLIPYYETKAHQLDVPTLATTLIFLFFLGFAYIGRHQRSFEALGHLASGTLYTINKQRTYGGVVSSSDLQHALENALESSPFGVFDPVLLSRAQLYVSIEMKLADTNCQHLRLDPFQRYRVANSAQGT